MSKRSIEVNRQNRLPLPVESFGDCYWCGVEAELGDEVCVKCWDRGYRGKRVPVGRLNQMLNEGRSFNTIASQLKVHVDTVSRLSASD